MLRTISNWLLDKGLILATLIIILTAAFITLIGIHSVLFVSEWFNRNWP